MPFSTLQSKGEENERAQIVLKAKKVEGKLQPILKSVTENFSPKKKCHVEIYIFLTVEYGLKFAIYPGHLINS